MNLLIFGLGVFALFLFSVWVLAIWITTDYSDNSASYKLYAIRDRIIGASVFDGVARNDPWLSALYDNVNSILVHSRLLAGPPQWPTAHAVGEYLQKHPHKAKRLQELPTFEPPDAIKPVLKDLPIALDHLQRHHIGLRIQISAQLREERRQQRAKAKELRKMVMGRNGLAGC